jgi:EAL domain-containing protein (putative c-di-GMP-specific phosphodiesterase class I)
LGQQRYAIASLRQLIAQPEAEKETSEQDLFKDALRQLDDVLKALPTDDKHIDTSGRKVDELKEREILTFIKKSLRNNQIALAIQPIKTMPLEQTSFYEVYSRIQVGKQYIPAGKFLSVAKDNGLMALIDQAFLLRSLQLIKKNVNDDAFIAYFCNVSTSSFRNKEFLESIIKYLEAQPRLSARLVFELSQEETFKMNDDLKDVFVRLVELGCRFSMDNVKMMGLDVDRLKHLHLSFVKFNVDAILKEIETPNGRRRWLRTRTWLASQGIEVIVEKVENAKQLDKLKDSGFSYAQGFYFGQPDIVA